MLSACKFIFSEFSRNSSPDVF